MAGKATKTARSYFSGYNFMTPDEVQYGFVGPYAYEISQGEGFNHDPLFGVTLIARATCESDFNLSRCFPTLDEARAYIRQLKERPTQSKPS